MIILGTNSIKDTGYDVANSLRFNSGSTDNLSRTFGTATSQKTFTWSFWYKKTKTATEMYFFENTGGAGTQGSIGFGNDDKIFLFDQTNGALVYSSLLLRDPSAWYHIVIRVDTTQSTATDRIRMYFSGVQNTLTGTQPSQNTDLPLVSSSGSEGTIGKYDNTNSNLDGYLAEVVFCDGQSLAPDQFGEFDEDSGIWKPIDVSGLTFGTNGFYLDFEDSAALGDDVSGNGNDFTVNNLTAVDKSSDTCTNNWCVQNSIATPISGSPTFSQGNLTIASGSGWKSTIGTFALTKGKWYWETKGGGSAGTILNGIASTAVIEAGGASNGVNNNATIGVNLPAYAYHGSSGAMYRSDTTGNGLDQGGGSWGTAYNTGDLISVYLDLDNYKLYTAKNNTLNVSGTGYSIASGYAYYPLCVPYTNTINLNYGIGAFGATAVSSAVADANGYGAFEYDPSRGGSSDFDSAAKDFLAICTKNLAEYG